MADLYGQQRHEIQYDQRSGLPLRHLEPGRLRNSGLFDDRIRNAGRTSFTPPATQQPPSEGMLYWRALASDQANAVQSAARAPQVVHLLRQHRAKPDRRTVYGGLWPGARPTGTHGRAAFGPGWQVRTIQVV